jgi:glycosyltransferase involved in cell wall biosynthesis
MFFGTPRPHKGVEDLIDAMALIKDKDVILVVAGLDNLPYCQGLLVAATGILKDRFRGFGIQPFEKVPEFLALADIVVIPQRRSVATFGQLPAKVFDAMALAKPIVATQVSDLPEILRDCGLTVEPENIGQLADAIRYLLEEPKKAEELGKKAREKCIEKYSWDTIEKILMVIFRKYEHIKTA